MELKSFQTKTIKQVLDALNNQSNHNIILKSPVGSGKTIMAANIIQQLQEQNPNNNFFVMWLSIGKGNLHVQSYNKISSIVDCSCNLIDSTYIASHNFFANTSVNFINWESITKMNQDGSFSNDLMRNSEVNSLLDVINKTKDLGFKFYCFVDEAHIGAMNKNTNAYDVLNNILKPDQIIHLTATPISLIADVFIEVNIDDVIADGLIKQSIIINDFDKSIVSNNNTDSMTYLLEQAINKQKTIKQEYNKLNSSAFNPLVLIQIPNAEYGEQKLNQIVDILNKFGINPANEKLKIWLNKTNLILEEQEKLKQPNNETEFLIFKTAIATGWDCPRACILVKFRESKSDIFDIQTIGRIYRSINGHKWNNNLLDSGFIYTDIKSFNLEKLDYKTINYANSELKDEFKNDVANLTFPSVIKETNNNESLLDINYMNFLELQFNSIKDTININKKLSDNMLYSSEINLNLPSHKSIYAKSTNVAYDDGWMINEVYKLIKQWNKRYLLYDNFNLLDYLAQLIYSHFGNVDVFQIILIHKDIFSKIIADSINIYKLKINKKIINLKKIDFVIPSKKYYNEENTYRTTEIFKKHLYKDVIWDKNLNDLEFAFIKMLENEDDVLWYYKNDNVPSIDSLNIPYIELDENGYETTRLFIPDFIVKFKNGKIGVFDTKANNDRNDIQNYTKNTQEKHRALFKWLKEQGDNFIGGIVVSGIEDAGIYGNFKIFNKETTRHPYKNNQDGWEDFDKIIKGNK